MKKLLTLVLGLFMMLSLASCGDSEQKVTIKNDKGENVEVVLNKTDDEKVVRQALTYAAQADYEEVKALHVDLNGNVKLTLNDKEGFEAEASLVLAADPTNEVVYGEAKGSFSGAFMSGPVDAQVLEKHTVSGSAHLAYNNKDPKDELYVYAGVSAKVDEEALDKKVKIAPQEISEMISQMMPSIPGIPSAPVQAKLAAPALPGLLQGEITEEDVNLVLAQLKAMFPNSKLEISYVSGEKFTLTYNLSMKDAIKSLDQVNGTEFSKELTNDFTVKLNVDFELKSGRFAGINFEVQNSFFVKLMGYTKEDITEKSDFHLKLSFNASYDSKEVKTLTAEEKAQYELYSFKNPTPEPEPAPAV